MADRRKGTRRGLLRMSVTALDPTLSPQSLVQSATTNQTTIQPHALDMHLPKLMRTLLCTHFIAELSLPKPMLHQHLR
jgi:hypothetical protein